MLRHGPGVNRALLVTAFPHRNEWRDIGDVRPSAAVRSIRVNASNLVTIADLSQRTFEKTSVAH